MSGQTKTDIIINHFADARDRIHNEEAPKKEISKYSSASTVLRRLSLNVIWLKKA